MPPEISDLSREHAIRLWTRRQSGSWTEDDERSLSAWLAASAANRLAYEKVVRLWSLAGGLERDGFDVVVPRPMVKVRKVAIGCAVVLLVDHGTRATARVPESTRTTGSTRARVRPMRRAVWVTQRA